MPSPGEMSTALFDPVRTDAAEVARLLGVDPAVGLSTADATARLADHGPNELRSTRRNPLWRRILAQFTDPLILLLLAAVVISLIAWIVEGAEGLPIDAIVILAIIVLNAVLGLVQESRAERRPRAGRRPGARRGRPGRR